MRENYLEVHVPISPHDFFFNRVRYLAKSLRSLGGDFSFSRIVVSVGDAAAPYDLDKRLPWARDEGIEWRWVHPEFFASWKQTNNPYVSTMMDRFRAGFTSKYVIIADADILFCRDPSDLIRMMDGRLDVGGVMTHLPPFYGVAGGTHAEWWTRMFNAFQMPAPALECEHSGWGHMFNDESSRYSPVYFNSGMVIGTGEAFNLMAPLAYPALLAVRSVLDTFYFDQIAFTLMMYKAGVSKKLIPSRFNFPNQASFEATFAEDANDVAVLHYLRTDTIDRDAIFNSPRNIENFMTRPDLTGGNELLRARVTALHAMLTEPVA